MVFNNLSHSLAQPEPVYESIPGSPYTPTTSMGGDASEDQGLRQSGVMQRRSLQLPTLSRFLADFTLGFADGLTVPFALTAGLSSLGQTSTVILAGMAEIAAGSISMGIGGYLSARGDIAAAAASNNETQDKSSNAQQVDAEKVVDQSRSTILDEYLGPLRLPQHLLDAVKAHAEAQPAVAAAILNQRLSLQDEDDSDSETELICSPVLNGLSVAMGYLLGGLLPLFPYFFVTEVGAGLKWSFGVCILALFVFGFTKHYLLQEGAEDKHWSHAWHYHSRRWNRVKQSAWEGLQMVILGSIAAFAALLCVKASELIVS
jgi:vacuolar iron transporter family protein